MLSKLQNYISWHLFKILDAYLLQRHVDIQSNSLLIIKLDAIGDYILFRNFFEVLRSELKNYKITLVGNILWKGIFEAYDNHQVDRVVWVETNKLESDRIYRFKLLKKINDAGFETTIYPNLLRHQFLGDELVRFSKSIQRIGWKDVNRNSALQIKLDNWYTYLYEESTTLFEFDRNKEFVKKFLKIDEIEPPFFLPISTIRKPNKVGIFIGGGHDLRRWKPVHLLCEFIIKNFPNIEIVLLGGEESKNEAIQLLQYNSQNRKIINIVGRTSLTALIDEIGSCYLLISNESSAVHIAAATCTPTICVSNGNHLGRFHPYPKHIFDQCEYLYPDVVQNEIDENGLNSAINKYYEGSELDVNLISLDTVVNRVNYRLKNGK